MGQMLHEDSTPPPRDWYFPRFLMKGRPSSGPHQCRYYAEEADLRQASGTFKAIRPDMTRKPVYAH